MIGRVFVMGVFALGLVSGCATPPESEELGQSEAAWGIDDYADVVGSIDVGETKQVLFRPGMKNRALTFEAAQGDIATFRLNAESADTIAFLLDSSTDVVGFPKLGEWMGAPSYVRDIPLDAGTYYLVFYELNNKVALIDVSVEVRCTAGATMTRPCGESGTQEKVCIAGENGLNSWSPFGECRGGC